MEDIPRLPDEHLAKAKEIISRHRTKKSCNRCYGRGFQGIDQNNMAILCHKCVDEDKVTQEWRAHVRDTPVLAEAYGDYFEAEAQEARDEQKPKVTHEPARRVAEDRGHRIAGAQHHRSTGR